MLNISGDSGQLSLVPDVREKAFNPSPLKIMFTVHFSYMASIMLRHLRLFLAYERFHHERILGFVKCLSVLIEM